MTEPPGASAWFAGGLVAYGDELKTGWLGVDPVCIVENGSVSAEVITAMLGGAAGKADWVIAESGIYGPGGDRPGKPLGTCQLGLRRPDGTTHICGLQLSGTRKEMRIQIQQRMRDLLMKQLDPEAGR